MRKEKCNHRDCKKYAVPHLKDHGILICLEHWKLMIDPYCITEHCWEKSVPTDFCKEHAVKVKKK